MSLVNTHWLKKKLSKVKIIDCSWHMPQANRNGFEEYKKLHIPNSIFFDLDKNSNQNTDLPHMLTDKISWENIVSSMGINNEDEIFESPDFYDFLSTSEEEKQKLDGYEFDIKDGVKNGKQREYIKQILRKEYEMKNDKWNGIHKEFDVNGQIKHKLNFKNGVRID